MQTIQDFKRQMHWLMKQDGHQHAIDSCNAIKSLLAADDLQEVWTLVRACCQQVSGHSSKPLSMTLTTHAKNGQRATPSHRDSIPICIDPFDILDG